MQVDEVVLLGAEDPLSTDVLETLARSNIKVVSAVLMGPPKWEVAPVSVVLQHDEVSAMLAKSPAVVGAHAPQARRSVRNVGEAAGFKEFATIIDPSAVVARSSNIAEGVYVNAGAIIAGHTSIADNGLINRGASLGHHSAMESYAVLGPGAIVPSNCRICSGAMLGAGAVLRPDIVVGPGSIVGAGAVVIRNVEANVVVAGNPARVIGEAPG
ncbi:MAG: hypothetical protein ACR2OM_09270 [Aestuariivirgaceae bacterium]